MKQKKHNMMKQYVSPHIKIHKLKFEGALLSLTTETENQNGQPGWNPPTRPSKGAFQEPEEDDLTDY